MLLGAFWGAGWVLAGKRGLFGHRSGTRGRHFAVDGVEIYDVLDWYVIVCGIVGRLTWGRGVSGRTQGGG